MATKQAQAEFLINRCYSILQDIQHRGSVTTATMAEIGKIMPVLAGANVDTTAQPLPLYQFVAGLADRKTPGEGQDAKECKQLEEAAEEDLIDIIHEARALLGVD